jgi:hypothetical protein
MNKFLKVNLYTYEVLTALITTWVVCTLIYYMAIYRFVTNITDTNYEIVKIGFDVEIGETIYSDVRFTVRSADNLGEYSGYVILNKDELENNNVIDELNAIGPEQCFIFETQKEAILGETYLNNLGKSFDDAISIILYTLIIVFVIFMKFNLTKINLSKIKNLKQEPFSLFDYQFFFSHVIFHLTVLLIIPTLNKRYIDVSFDFCFSMSKVYYNSMFFDRKFIWESQKELHEFYTKAEYTGEKYKDGLFFLQSRNFIESASQNNYVLNILLLCIIVWICKINSIFGVENNTSVSNGTISKRRKYIGLGICVLVYGIWLFFLVIGVLELIDEMILYYGFIFHYGKNILNPHIMKSILVFYIQVYFYIVLLVASLQRGEKKIDLYKNYKVNSVRSSQIKLLSGEQPGINRTSSSNTNIV